MKSYLTQKLLLVLASLLLIGGVIWSLAENRTPELLESHTRGKTVKFDQPSGFYTHDLTVHLRTDLEVPFWASLRYTLNGDEPTADSPRWPGRLHLSVGESPVSVYPLQVRLCYPDHHCGQIYRQTYVLGANLDESVDLDIVSLTCDWHDLYDYERGIFMLGKTYDDNIANGTGDAGNNRQRGEQWRREAGLTMFDATGQLLLEQPVGIMVSGDTSSVHEVKSLKIIANRKYGYQPLPLALYQPGDSSPWPLRDTYNSLRLRSGSQDRIITNIRSSVISQLVQETDFPGITTTHRVAVYLNGEFWGVHDLQQNYSNSFLAAKFRLPDTDQIVKVKGGEWDVLRELGVDELFVDDLENIGNRQRLEAAVDIDNFLTYYALNVVINNIDWATKNYEGWRYTGEPRDDNPYTDGRVRFLLYDTDYVYRLQEMYFFDEIMPDNTLENLLSFLPQHIPAPFATLMKTPEYRDRFVTIVCHLLGGPFRPEHVLEVMAEQHDLIDHQTKLNFSSEYYQASQDYYQEMIDNVNGIKDRIAQEIATYWGLSETYSVQLHTDAGTSLIAPGLTVWPEQTHRADYYAGVPFTLTAQLNPHYEWVGWLVNGELISNPELTVSEQLMQDRQVIIEVVSQLTQATPLIEAVANSSQGSWVRVINPTAQPLNLGDYQLTDDLDNVSQCQLPAVSLDPQESLTIYTQDSLLLPGEYLCPFHIQAGQPLYLMRAGIEQDSLTPPELNDYESYGRYRGTNQYRYFWLGEGSKE